ncbi:MAG: hypothetical protein Q7R30_09315 [Acidobacteriota bacterium]|nr:hypothetical protein [Acidobacteriota bacterium]
MDLPINDDRENARGDEDRVQKKIWCTPVLIIADVSTSGASKIQQQNEADHTRGPSS